jgi:hypothetical protein
MEQPTGSLGTTSWARLDASVRPAVLAEPPRPTTPRLGTAVSGLGGRLRSPSVTQRVGAADAVGRALQRAGGYFDTHDLRDIRSDAERLIVRRPVASVFLAVVVGYLAGRALWR